MRPSEERRRGGEEERRRGGEEERRRDPMLSVQVERLDHVGIVAGVCQEIGLAAIWTDWLVPVTGR